MEKVIAIILSILVQFRVPCGILGQVRYLIVSISDFLPSFLLFIYLFNFDDEFESYIIF